MKISVVTVCYNSAATIADTLRSVAAQTHADVEHIVVDGKSSDATMEIVERHRGRLARVVSERDGGIWDAMNKGLKMATGDVVGFLNADDVFAAPDALARIAAAFDDASVDACYADLVYVDAADMSRVVRYWKSRPYAGGLFRTGWMPAHPTFYVRRAVYERLGGFDARFPRQADFELTMRLVEIHRIKCAYIPHILVKMRMGGVSNNNFRNVMKGNVEAWRACRHHGLRVPPWFVLRKMLGRVPQFFRKPPAAG